MILASSSPETLTLLLGILDESPNGIVAYQPVWNENNKVIDYKTVYYNQKAQKLLGYTADEFANKSLFERFPEARTYETRYMAFIQQNQPFVYESYFEKVECWLELQARRLGKGFFLTLRDVSDRKQAQLDLARQSEQLTAIFESSLNGITAMRAIRDETGNTIDFLIETANAATMTLTGRSPADTVGTRLLATFPGNEEAGFLALYQQVIDDGEPRQTTQYYQDQNGLEAWFEVSAVRQGTEQVVVTYSDVTAAQKIQKQLLESNQSLEQFASVASHDLQEPLRKVQSFGNLLAEQYGPQLGESGQDLIMRMQRAADRMSTLIRDLLAFSRLSNQPDISKPVDLNTLVAEVLTDLETRITDRKAQIDVPALPIIMGNALTLRQLIQNLIGNALKFSRPGISPHIQIKTEQVEGKSVPTSPITARSGTYWAIQVADNGIGFDEQYKERIFGAFQRLHSRSSAYPGTGIGLAIVKKVIDQHQGFIEARSTVGEGATFTVYLPAIADA